MASCDSEPVVTNARATLVKDNDTLTVTYECLTGFYMTGTARLVCNQTTNIWGSPPPTCKVIYQGSTYNVYNNIPSTVEGWWYYLLAGLLGLLALLLFSAVIWCCCCFNKSSVHPYEEHNQDKRACCPCCCCHRLTTVRLHTDEHLHQNGQTGNKVLVESSNSEIKNNTSSVETTQYLRKNSMCSHNSHTHVTPVLDVDHSHQRHSEANDRTESVGQSTTHKKEAQIYRNARPAKDPNRIWLPHTHGVRNNNTSTK